MRRTALLLSLILFLLPYANTFAESVNIHAVVPATAADFSVSLSTTDTDATAGQSHTIPFKITYSNKLSYATNLTIKASWTKGTVQGDSSPSIEVVDYLNGSATNAYASTPPVIDTLNRTITWTISSYPGNDTESEVNFSLKTSNSLSSTTPISFSIDSSLAGPGINKPGNSLTTVFKTDPIVATPTPTPGPTTTTTAAPSVTITPTTPVPSPTDLESVTVRTVQSSSSEIAMNFTSPSAISVSYGTSPKSLDQNISYTTRASTQVVRLSSLKPGTTYYFQIASRDAAGKKTVSDIFSFKTSKEDSSSPPEIDSFVMSSNEVILSSNNQEVDPQENKVSAVVIPSSFNYEFRFSIPNASNLKSVEAFLRNKKVLGLSSLIDKVYADTDAVDLIETSPGVYLGRLRAPVQAGLYELYLRIGDTDGNVLEKKVSDIKISSPLTVLSRENNEKIEGAKVTLYFWNAKKKTFEKLNINGIMHNPLFTNKEGIADLILPKGKYRAVVRTIHFKETSVEFTIGQSTNDGYPTIRLQKSSFDPLAFLIYFGSAIGDVFLPSTDSYLGDLAASNRILHLLVFVALLSLLVLTFLSTSARMQIPLLSLPSYFIHHLKRLFSRGKEDIIKVEGKIIDHKEDHALANVNIYFLSPETEQIITHCVSRKDGSFIAEITPGTYKISILKSGYEALILTKTLEREAHLSLALAAHPRPESLAERVSHFIGYVISTSFEILLFGTLLLLIEIALTSGWKDILPLIVISSINVILWYLHRR